MPCHKIPNRTTSGHLQAVDIFRNYATPVPNPDHDTSKGASLALSGTKLSPRVPSNPMPRDTNPGPASSDSQQSGTSLHPLAHVPNPRRHNPLPPAHAHLQATNASLNAFAAALADTTDDEPPCDGHARIRSGHRPISGTQATAPSPQTQSHMGYWSASCAMKADPYRTQITLGGNSIRYPGDCSTKSGSLETVKLLLNSVLSTPTARFASFDISNFYLGTPLDRPKYACIKLTDIPDEFIQEYGLQDFAYNGYIYFEVTKGVYGLKQAGTLTNDLLTQRLKRTDTTNWPIIFVLIVDDFGIQFTDRRHAEHLLHALQEHYTVTTNWMGTKFAGIDITWDYTKRTCRLTMDTYISTLLLKYNHPGPCKPQHAPNEHREIIYGAKEQLLPDKDTSPPLDAAGIKRTRYCRLPPLLCPGRGQQAAGGTQHNQLATNGRHPEHGHSCPPTT
eukprot:CCRYP_015694-RA/>CCRYP_015694-RA protein AED:0.28 eAED:0.29 QI:0/0/0/1/0.5/0.33/3/0/447